MSFDSFAFHPLIKAGITTAGYSTPTPIQSKSITPIIEGHDLLGLAQTGTGKTAAFVLPLLQRLLTGQRGKLRALILAPTRELAEQTHAVIQVLGRETGLRSMTIYGGVSELPQVKGLRAGIEIGVACPGRLLDLMQQKVVNLASIEILVLDEADHMFDMGFLPSIRKILAALPVQRQTLLFSATMPPEIRTLATDLLRKPVIVEIGDRRPVDSVSHAVYPIDPDRKYETLLGLISQAGSGQILIFTRTKHRAKKLALQLANTGLAAKSLQGNLSQNRRQEVMDGFRNGQVRVMVATDIASRGIDVSQITHVINYDIPDTAEAYIHRTGRTGRMAKLGTALTLITQEDLLMVRKIERMIGYSMERREIARSNPPKTVAFERPQGGAGRTRFPEKR